MKAISLWQPWAVLVAIGAKKWETRCWQTNYRGRIAIHAAKKWNADLYSTAATWPFLDALTDAGIAMPAGLEFGGIVAVADLTEIITTRDWMRRHCKTPADPGLDREYCFGDYGPGRFAWKLENVRPVRPMVPTRGRQQLWNLTEEERLSVSLNTPRIRDAMSGLTSHQRAQWDLFREGKI